jgi:hypothetical protein
MIEIEVALTDAELVPIEKMGVRCYAERIAPDPTGCTGRRRCRRITGFRK